MISSLFGNIIYNKPPQILIDVNGVGYEVNLPISEFCLLPKNDAKIKIYTHLMIREDSHTLYGFTTIEGRDCFRNIIKVSGIGAKIGLAILSTLLVEELYLALNNNDVNQLCRVPGIGKKVAERMILELSGKLVYNKDQILNASKSTTSNVKVDTINALLSLGYNEKEIYKIIPKLSADNTDINTMIKESLKLLNTHKSS